MYLNSSFIEELVLQNNVKIGQETHSFRCFAQLASRSFYVGLSYTSKE